MAGPLRPYLPPPLGINGHRNFIVHTTYMGEEYLNNKSDKLLEGGDEDSGQDAGPSRDLDSP